MQVQVYASAERAARSARAQRAAEDVSRDVRALWARQDRIGRQRRSQSVARAGRIVSLDEINDAIGE